MLVRALTLTVLLLLPWSALPAGSLAPETRAIPLAAGGLHDVAMLAPYDPRAPELAASAPELARGLWSGTLATSGGLVRLVEMEGASVALVELAGALAWFTLEEGTLVPLAVEIDAPVEIDSELRAPRAAAGSALPAVASPRDGKLQLLMDADRSFTTAWNVAPDGAARGQLALISLVDAMYRVNLGVEIEVIEQHQRTDAATFTLPITCTGSPGSDLLGQFRSHWEARAPTTSHPREAAIIFTSRTPVAHPDGGTLIGCAFIYELESDHAYASARLPILSNFALDLTQNVYVVAHELGHNFGGLHERALPTPGGALDIAGCTGATIMYPFLCENAPMFSDTRELESRGILPDLALEGGNAPWMESFAQSRL